MARLLSNSDVAFIMELRTEMATQSGRAPKNFWWAVGQVFGLDPKVALEAVRHAEQWGMEK